MLPTARGFDYFLGYLGGATYYWSKEDADHPNVIDFMYANKECYSGYNGSDMNRYSTLLYQDKSIDIINNHDYSSTPLFLYLAFQGVHDPFGDDAFRSDGLTITDMTRVVYEYVMQNIVGTKRQQYALALYMIDSAVQRIYSTLDDVGQLDNTYLIFA
jgi:arylsulfatase A-like enzyme